MTFKAASYFFLVRARKHRTGNRAFLFHKLKSLLLVTKFMLLITFTEAPILINMYQHFEIFILRV